MMIHVLTNYAVSKRIYLLHLSKLGEYLKKNLHNRSLVYRVYIHFVCFFYVFSLIV